ncbi:uncharacterized protein (DUF2141 family) [Actimicrobium sp. GrIS 1.19]|uniref:DUF2141 domain-containing protein n=1 Tax=Actimicrobium sp. GrIS 1.19 TaxID=3071708 RepID=UPI002DFB2402|nr:uncharacterized protein (DUF2141 family) [Actimicrobium sp. GrIS 1.19]
MLAVSFTPGAVRRQLTAMMIAVALPAVVHTTKLFDTNFIGLPMEQWGVSNEVRPRMRAPRFDEAAFKVASDNKEVVIDIRVSE